MFLKCISIAKDKNEIKRFPFSIDIIHIFMYAFTVQSTIIYIRFLLDY